MANLNKVMIIGNLGKSAELRYMSSGTPQATFSVAVSENRKKGDDWVSETEWFNVCLWGDSAERQSQYLTKGTPVFVEGKLRTRTWDKNDGTKGYMTEVIADRVQTLSKRESSGDTWKSEKASVEDLDDLPFE